MTLPQILIVTGLMASGKSTVAQALAERLPRSVHVRGDIFRKMIVGGRVEVTPSPDPEARRQLELRYAIACQSCLAYANAGFNVVYQDVILGHHLQAVCDRLQGFRPGVVMLRPSSKVIRERDLGRTKQAYGDAWTPNALSALLDETPKLGLQIDTSRLSVDQTVAEILSRRAETLTS